MRLGRSASMLKLRECLGTQPPPVHIKYAGLFPGWPILESLSKKVISEQYTISMFSYFWLHPFRYCKYTVRIYISLSHFPADVIREMLRKNFITAEPLSNIFARHPIGGLQVTVNIVYKVNR